MSEAWIERLGKGDMVAVRVGDHYGLDPVARCPMAGIDAQLVQPPYLIFDAGDNERERAGTGAFGQLVDLQPSATLEAPFGYFRHRPGWRPVQDSLIPLDGRPQVFDRDTGQRIL